MNTTGLEWFRPPERNTLRPLCVVLLTPQEAESLGVSSAESRVSLRELLCAASASLLYLKGGAYIAIGSPTGGPNRCSIK